MYIYIHTYVNIYEYTYENSTRLLPDAGWDTYGSTEGPSWGYPSPALPRSWGHFVGNCCRKLTILIKINF